jgi:putative ABC transport system substrate-binding protein
MVRVVEASGPSLGVEIKRVPIHEAGEIENAINDLGRQPCGGLYVAPDITTIVNRKLIAALAVEHRLPAIYSYRFFAISGGLASYGTDIADHYRLAAGYIDRILQGRKTGPASRASSNEVRTDDQSQGRQGDQPRNSCDAARAR